tara:strand:- start:1342 stop:1587 length:246 start_codon:yes stop_codon:yes gene_type:complete
MPRTTTIEIQHALICNYCAQGFCKKSKAIPYEAHDQHVKSLHYFEEEVLKMGWLILEEKALCPTCAKVYRMIKEEEAHDEL